MSLMLHEMLLSPEEPDLTYTPISSNNTNTAVTITAAHVGKVALVITRSSANGFNPVGRAIPAGWTKASNLFAGFGTFKLYREYAYKAITAADIGTTVGGTTNVATSTVLLDVLEWQDGKPIMTATHTAFDANRYAIASVPVSPTPWFTIPISGPNPTYVLARCVEPGAVGNGTESYSCTFTGWASAEPAVGTFQPLTHPDPTSFILRHLFNSGSPPSITFTLTNAGTPSEYKHEYIVLNVT